MRWSSRTSRAFSVATSLNASAKSGSAAFDDRRAEKSPRPSARRALSTSRLPAFDSFAARERVPFELPFEWPLDFVPLEREGDEADDFAFGLGATVTGIHTP